VRGAIAIVYVVIGAMDRDWIAPAAAVGVVLPRIAGCLMRRLPLNLFFAAACL